MFPLLTSSGTDARASRGKEGGGGEAYRIWESDFTNSRRSGCEPQPPTGLIYPAIFHRHADQAAHGDDSEEKFNTNTSRPLPAADEITCIQDEEKTFTLFQSL